MFVHNATFVLVEFNLSDCFKESKRENKDVRSAVCTNSLRIKSRHKQIAGKLLPSTFCKNPRSDLLTLLLLCI